MMIYLYTRLINAIADIKENDKGISAIEYGLMAVLIALAFTVGATALGGALDGLFSRIATALA